MEEEGNMTAREVKIVRHPKGAFPSSELQLSGGGGGGLILIIFCYSVYKPALYI
jgi:hypothetical protein